MKTKTEDSKMRKFALNVILLCMVVSLMGCASNGREVSDVPEDEKYTRTYEVFGMDCPGCHGGLENLVNDISGVKTSKANWDKKQLLVMLHPNIELDDEEIYNAIQQANFTPGKRLR